MYEILLHPDAQKVYARADKALAKKIAKCLQQLEQESLNLFLMQQAIALSLGRFKRSLKLFLMQ